MTLRYLSKHTVPSLLHVASRVRIALIGDGERAVGKHIMSRKQWSSLKYPH